MLPDTAEEVCDEGKKQWLTWSGFVGVMLGIRLCVPNPSKRANAGLQPTLLCCAPQRG